MYNGLNIIEDAFEKRIFEHEGRPMIDVDYETSSDTYHLTSKELQAFKKLFKYNNPNKLREALMGADGEKYHELKDDVKTIQDALKEQINKTNDGVKSTRLENLVNAIENVLGHVIK